MSDTYVYALLGGALIGLAAAGLLWSNGKILGVSGIVGGALKTKGANRHWRLGFILGMVAGAFLISPLGFSILQQPVNRPLVWVATGGLLVGLGTSIGNGCTSGHGVCGIGRGSGRSFLATVVFMTMGIITTALVNFLLGGD